MRHGLTLKEMSARTGVPFSTLSKVEHDRLTLTYDKLLVISERLNIPISALFADPDTLASTVANSRRSLASETNALRIETPNYDYFFLSPDLRTKAMVPVVSHIKAHDMDAFGPLTRHRGEEFCYVLKGKVVVHTEYYDPVVLGPEEAVYIDSTMGHAYVLADGCASAVTLCICSTSQEELIDIALASRGGADTRAVPEARTGKPGRRRKNAA